MRYGISAYDAHFVSVAIDLGELLVTGDKKILRDCGDVATSIEEFARGEASD